MKKSLSAASADAMLALADEVPRLFFRLRAVAEELHADTGMTPGKRAILRDIVERGALSAPQLAALRSLTRQAVQPFIDDLIADDLAYKAPNPNHQRSPLIAATPAGRRIYKKIRTTEVEALSAAAPDFSVAELQSTADVLRRLCALLDERVERHEP